MNKRKCQKASLSTVGKPMGKVYSSADARVTEAAGKANLPWLTWLDSEEMSRRERKLPSEGA